MLWRQWLDEIQRAPRTMSFIPKFNHRSTKEEGMQEDHSEQPVIIYNSYARIM